ncbi:ABC transporter permease [Mesorhizobium sp. BHbsci]
MTNLLAFLLSNPTILAVGAGIIGAAAAWMHGRVTGAKAERLNHISAEAKARGVAGLVQNGIGALPADAARKELNSWEKD